MPGLGKSTLANKVYRNTLVASYFNVHTWCTISQKFNKSKVLQVILQQVAGSEGEKESNEGGKVVDLAEKLRKELYDKRYVIVLDDVWDIATVEMLITCFPRVERGNRIILTSRSSKVDQGSCPAELSKVGHQIVEKCQGLPLAAVLIAVAIIRGKKKEKDLWLKIPHNMDSLISANNNLQMTKVMQLSYDYLPYHLKPLLLYFGRFQKNKQTPVSKLMQLWIAEGSVDHYIPSKSSLEEITQSYLDALISSSLVMVDRSVSKSSHPFSVSIKACYVHDVVYDFCSVKAKKEKCSDGSKHLISLKVKNWLDPFSHIRHFGLIKVLQLDLCKISPTIVIEPSESRNSVDLKQAFYHGITAQNNQTVKAETCEPNDFLKWRNITSSFFEEEKDNIIHQPSRILEAECSKLEYLTALSRVDISYSQGTINALGKFPNLQHFDCNIVEPNDPSTHGNWFPKFDVLNKLESLILSYRDFRSKLRLHGFPPRPALFLAIATLPKLEILEFIHSDFLQDKWDASEDIYQSLKTLRLANVFLTEWQVDTETFPKLVELILEHCHELTEIPSAFGDIDTLKSIRVVQPSRHLSLEIQQQKLRKI
ncbi:hypothetical protein H5410_022548 [Solanum commersonii]|uniref:NB-ARC domain-containing protein n=1 Tax=Solanum commersonii TaxID=4109 RepID=A0A9J5ZEB6_SOLCO|nr:hypothetical protein H5410_022548 [Solanum commersonii]